MEARNEFGLEHLKDLFPEIPGQTPEDDRYKQMLEVIFEGFLERINRKSKLYSFDGRSIRVGGAMTVKLSLDGDEKGNMEQISFRSRLSWISPEKDPARKVTRLFRNYVKLCDLNQIMSSVEEVFEKS